MTRTTKEQDYEFYAATKGYAYFRKKPNLLQRIIRNIKWKLEDIRDHYDNVT